MEVENCLVNMKYIVDTSFRLKRREAIWLAISSQFKSPHLCWDVGALVPMEMTA